MLEQIIAAVHQAIDGDLPDVEEEVWGIVDNRAAKTGVHVRRPTGHELEVYAFPQCWGSTALGFSGVGGQAMTTAQTVIVSLASTACVYFGGRLAYKVEDWQRNEMFLKDMKAHRMAALYETTRYRQ